MADPEHIGQAQRALGRKLAVLRKGAGLNQFALAGAVDYSRSTIANLEVGRQNAPRDFRSRCDDVLAAGGSLRREFEALEALRASLCRAEARTIHVPTAPGARLPVTYIPFLPAALDRPALDWLLGGGPDTSGGRSGAPLVDGVLVAAAAERLQDLRELDHRFGAGTVYPQVERFIATEVRQILSGRTADSGDTDRVRRVATGAYELAGYQAVDLGADGLAQRHYLHALALTGPAGDRTLGAYLLGVSLGHLALHCGHPRRALQMAQTAIQGTAGRVTPAVSAALHAVLARAHARLGDEPACTAALQITAADLERIDLESEPAWVRYLTPGYVADELAHCMFDLGLHQSAQREIKQAVDGVGAGRVRRLAIDTALLASSLARSGEVDGACAWGRSAVDLAAQTTSMRAVQRVAQLHTDLAPYASLQQARELDEYVRTMLPAAV